MLLAGLIAGSSGGTGYGKEATELPVKAPPLLTTFSDAIQYLLA